MYIMLRMNVADWNVPCTERWNAQSGIIDIWTNLLVALINISLHIQTFFFLSRILHRTAVAGNTVYMNHV